MAESDFTSRLELDEDPEFKNSESKHVTLNVHWHVLAADKSMYNALGLGY